MATQTVIIDFQIEDKPGREKLQEEIEIRIKDFQDEAMGYETIGDDERYHYYVAKISALTELSQWMEANL